MLDRFVGYPVFETLIDQPAPAAWRRVTVWNVEEVESLQIAGCVEFSFDGRWFRLTAQGVREAQLAPSTMEVNNE